MEVGVNEKKKHLHDFANMTDIFVVCGFPFSLVNTMS